METVSLSKPETKALPPSLPYVAYITIVIRIYYQVYGFCVNFA